MKSLVLNTADRNTVETLCSLMMEMNNVRQDNNADGSEPYGTYGHLNRAIVAFVENQTAVNIAGEDWNMGGNRCYADDIQVAIEKATERKLRGY